MQSKRSLRLPISVQVESIQSSRVVTIDLRKVAITDWCLNLCLLKEELVEELVFVGQPKLKVRKAEVANDAGRAKIALLSSEVDLILSLEELDYWLTFFLKSYRDGLAPVDHLDIEATTSETPQEQIDVVIIAGEAQPPVTAEETRRRLGML